MSIYQQKEQQVDMLGYRQILHGLVVNPRPHSEWSETLKLGILQPEGGLRLGASLNFTSRVMVKLNIGGSIMIGSGEDMGGPASITTL